MNLVEFVKERAKEFGNKVFLWEEKKSLTYKEFDEVTNRMGAGLQALGLKKGDHAAVLFPNSLDTLLGYFSIIKAGGTAIPINPLYTPREIAKAYLTLKPGQTTTDKEIVEFCKQNLAPYKVPRQVEIRSELPKSTTGKILHRELRTEKKR
jgi:acyl-CoA synthetase (AMP-forming)/AMP-acid ligase II